MVLAQESGDQQTFWNGAAGRGWVETQVLRDQLFGPVEERLVEAVAAGSGGRVLDVGSGTGATTLAIARLFGAKGTCVGIDISDAMIAAARARAGWEDLPAKFIRADAQTHAFQPASVDMIVSRFGVMFFDDPVRAFSNLRRAARGGAALRFVAWRRAEENPFMTTAERAAASLLDFPARPPDGPGQFAFGDRDRVDRVLQESGWIDVDIQPLDVECRMPERDLVCYLTWMGPVGRFLQEADDRTRRQVIETVRSAFEPYVHGDDVRVPTACWMVGARAPVESTPRSGS
jgi:SAM-dependent methyltransferase